MSQFNVYGKGVLFKGAFVPSDALPWDYLPVWIGISTPIIVLIGFVIGIGNWLKSGLTFTYLQKGYWVTKQKGWISGSDPLHWLAIIYWVAIPIFSLYIFDSVIYNSWRHLFFIYPAIVLFSVRGYVALHKWFSELTRRQTLVTILTLLILMIGLAEPIEFLSKYYRYGIVYFNQLAGDPNTLRQRYEMDYQGVSFKEAIDYILATDQSDRIPIYFADVSGLNYINSGLTKEQKSRIVIMDSPDNGARYFIGDYSFHPQEYEYAKFLPEYYSVTVRGVKILVVYRFQHP
jgi:hypothetical protein